MYSYDRRLASSTDQILGLIVKKALTERNTEALVQAYVAELEEDWEESHEDADEAPWQSDAEHAKWLTKTFGILHKPHEVEQVMADAFVETYRHLVRHSVSRAEALDVFMFPLPGFPDQGVPKTIAVAVAQALARRDAAEANQMHEWAKAHS